MWKDMRNLLCLRMQNGCQAQFSRAHINCDINLVIFELWSNVKVLSITSELFMLNVRYLSERHDKWQFIFKKLRAIFFQAWNGILLPKLFWLTVRKKWSGYREKLLKFEAEGWEFAKFLRSLEQFVQMVKGQNNFW